MVPKDFKAANIIDVLHCAEPLVSKYFIGFGFSKPFIVRGKFFFVSKLAPNFFNGLITLEKSLFDKLLSPISLILFFELISNPKIILPKVPEFPALIKIFPFFLI